jgi:rod shape-determining protein MreB and related proteins
MIFGRLFNSFRGDLGIDLGTANTLIYSRGRGIVVDEPSVIAFNKITHKVEAIDREAKQMLGRTPRSIVAIEPLKEGVISNLGAVEKMLQHYINRAHYGNGICRPGVVIGVPARANQTERRAVEDAAYRARASRVLLVEEAMAADE